MSAIKQKIQETIVQILSSYEGVVYSDDVVEMLVSRAEKSTVPGSELGYAYVVARNWAFSQRRAIARAQKAAVQKTLKDAKKAAEAIHVQSREQQRINAYAEFDRLSSTLPSRRKTMPTALRYTRMICLDDKSDPECADTFPGTTRDARYQWLKRARDLLLPHASEDLKVFLLAGTSQKKP